MAAGSGPEAPEGIAGYTFGQDLRKIADSCRHEHQVKHSAPCRITESREISPGLYTNSVYLDADVPWKQDHTEVILSGIYTFVPDDIFAAHSSASAVFYAFEFMIDCGNIRTIRKWY